MRFTMVPLRYVSDGFCGDIVVFLGFKVLTLMILLSFPAVKMRRSKDLSLCHKLKFSNPYKLYLSNLMVQIFDISNLDYLIYQNS